MSQLDHSDNGFALIHNNVLPGVISTKLGPAHQPECGVEEDHLAYGGLIRFSTQRSGLQPQLKVKTLNNLSEQDDFEEDKSFSQEEQESA